MYYYEKYVRTTLGRPRFLIHLKCNSALTARFHRYNTRCTGAGQTPFQGTGFLKRQHVALTFYLQFNGHRKSTVRRPQRCDCCFNANTPILKGCEQQPHGAHEAFLLCASGVPEDPTTLPRGRANAERGR